MGLLKKKEGIIFDLTDHLDSVKIVEMKTKIVIGIDEAGRGPLAGSVAVGAFLLREEIIKEIKKQSVPLRDSKKLSEKQREFWFRKIKEWKKEGRADFSVHFESAFKIDKIGISICIKNSLNKSLDKIFIKECEHILLDGGLKAEAKYKNQRTIIKGDEKEPSIMLASICAKVMRDRRMVAYSKRFKEYGFERHKGYGTEKHLENIRVFGLSPIHRKTYIKQQKSKAKRD